MKRTLKRILIAGLALCLLMAAIASTPTMASEDYTSGTGAAESIEYESQTPAGEEESAEGDSLEEEYALAPMEEMSVEEAPGIGIFAGYIWYDSNRDGIYNSLDVYLGDLLSVDEYKVYVYLYSTSDLTTPIRSVQLDIRGYFTMWDVPEGSYRLGIKATTYGFNTLQPAASMQNRNKYATGVAGGSPDIAYTKIYNIMPNDFIMDQDVDGTYWLDTAWNRDSTRALIEAKPKNSYVWLDGVEWVVMDKKNDNGNKYSMLALRWAQDTGRFNPTNAGHVYEGSELQNFFTGIAPSYPYTMSLAVQPTVDIVNSSQTEVTAPTTTAAAAPYKNVFFAPTYRDIFNLNGGRASPLAGPFETGANWGLPLKFWTRTASNTGGTYPNGHTLWEVNMEYINKQLGSGAQETSAGLIRAPFVWVKTGSANVVVTVFYVDTADNPIGSPTSKQYTIASGSNFNLDSGEIPYNFGYDYHQWKIGLGGTTKDKSVAVSEQNVTTGISIYLIYTAALRDITIGKTVNGPYSDLTKQFEFTVTFKNGANPLSANTSFSTVGTNPTSTGTMTLGSGGTAKVYLKHGQTLTIKNVDAKYSIQIVETTVTGYTASYTDSKTGQTVVQSRTFPFDQLGMDNRTIAFTNSFSSVPPTGISDNATGFSFFRTKR